MRVRGAKAHRAAYPTVFATDPFPGGVHVERLASNDVGHGEQKRSE